MTNSWNDIKNADVVIIMGGNAAEAHPCGFKWVTEAKANNGAKLIVVDPRFTRSASVSDLYAPLRPGTDKFERVSWDFAMDRITKLAKEDRDKNFIAKNRDGVTVNRWLSTGFLGGSSCSNEAGYLTYKVVRSTGILALENQARI